MDEASRFLADESCDGIVVRVLREQGHDVLDIAADHPGASDERVIGLAHAEGRVLLTEDTDFGWLVFRRKESAPGVVLFRFRAESRGSLPDAVRELAETRLEDLEGRFTVVEPGKRPRIRRLPPEG